MGCIPEPSFTLSEAQELCGAKVCCAPEGSEVIEMLRQYDTTRKSEIQALPPGAHVFHVKAA